MSMEFVNRICPNCKNPNYMVSLGDFSKAYKYKCMNCNEYFNDIDFEKEPLQPVWKSECMNTKVDMVEVVRCKNCKHGEKSPTFKYYPDVTWCNKYLTSHNDDWFCADGKRREDDLLKEQEEQKAVEPIAKEDDTYECICGAVVGWDELDASGMVQTRLNYCPFCGKAVKWE